MARILIIEEAVPVRELLQDFLDQKGHRTVGVGSSGEGLELQYGNPFPLVITGLFLPSTEGLETILKFKRDTNAKIIAISDGIGSLSLAVRMGANRSFFMPFDVREVATAVDELLGERS